jgi:Phage stabilisation protein
MPFTQNPTEQTQSTKRFSFISPGSMRGTDTTKDYRLLNFVGEVIDVPGQSNNSPSSKEFYTRTRPGLTTVYTITSSSSPKGTYNWNGHIMSVIGGTVYYDGTLLQVLPASSGGDVGWTEFLDSTGTRKLVMVDGTYGYVFTAYNAAPTQIVDADFPTPHVANPVFMDGYLYLAKANTQDIYNSDLDNPAVWTAGNFISAEMYPDTIQCLSKNNNYLYAVGQTTIEYFYDAGNATGTPLARHDAAVQQFGTEAPRSVIQTDKEVFLIGDTGAGGRTVWAIDGFKASEIGSATVKTALDAEGTSITTTKAFSIRTLNQKFYVFTLPSSGRTFAYSSDSKDWYEWTFTYPTYYSTDYTTGSPVAQVFTGSQTIIAKFDATTFADVGSQLTGTITTPRMDFGTIDRKRCDLLVIVGDAPNGASNVALGVQWSNDDYQTLSTSRTLYLNPSYSGIFRLGMFRRRSYKFTYNQPYPWRAEGMEITVNKGST